MSFVQEHTNDDDAGRVVCRNCMDVQKSGAGHGP